MLHNLPAYALLSALVVIGVWIPTLARDEWRKVTDTRRAMPAKRRAFSQAWVVAQAVAALAITAGSAVAVYVAWVK